MTVLADKYLSLIRVIAGDTRWFKAILLILLGRIGFEMLTAILRDRSYPNLKHYSKRINAKPFMIIFQLQSQADPKHYGKRINLELFMIIFQLQSQAHPKHYSKRINLELFMIIFQLQSQAHSKHYSRRINLKLFVAIFQPRSQQDPKHYNKGNAIDIPQLIHLTILWLRVAVANDEESSQNHLHPHDS